MYIVETGLILLAVYIAPALALRPQLAADARTAAAIPFLSAVLAVIAATVLIWLGAYTPLAIRIIAALCVAAAAIRLWRIRTQFRTQFVSSDGGRLEGRIQVRGWTPFDRGAAAVALSLGLYVVLRMIEGGFDENDEIYSWNLWAIQHFLGEPIDYYYTQSPYPQLFPKLLSYGYMLLGSYEAQTPVKTALAIFPVTLFFLLGLAAKTEGANRGLYTQAGLGLFLLLGIELSRIFDNGMPDVMMMTAIMASIFYLILHQRQDEKAPWLILSALCASFAALSKQPGLIWALFSLPALLTYGAMRNRNQWPDLWIGLTPALFALIWMTTEGRDFQQNDGVADMSRAGRDFLGQLGYSIETWLLGMPALAILTAAAIVAVIRSKRGADIMLLFVMPSAIAWLFFAAYDIRAGAPAIGAMALMIARTQFGLKPAQARQRDDSTRIKHKRILVGGLFAVSALGGAYELHKYAGKYQDFRIADTTLSNLFPIFGDDAQYVHDELLTPDVTIWTPTNYVYGLFYGHAQLRRPPLETTPFDEAALIRQIRAERPDYLTNAGGVPVGTGGRALDRVAQELCPDLFERVAGPDAHYGIAIYRLNKPLLDEGYCAL